ncbi:hypothetical protein ACQR1W_31495 [Bradyrhizobium sp. HKCCYLS1011]|uniref:hypothetical protein n=1 Tax=Bradyrhizobium sp. HKCCYLS1011 TaxID=3420733 RepID=UPI003EBAEDD8
MTIMPSNIDWIKLISGEEPPIPGLFNVRDMSGRIMLSCDVDRIEAEEWLAYYQNRYAQGRPFANGKGFHSDHGFHLVEVTVDGAYEEPEATPDIFAA